ncbi:MAG: SLC13 family permease [Thaumarchaeota archaeon]|nr:SLC13 family permease [Candidatus Calditenuaceae archaeon]MDW8041439.1 SLC13 family permease [Nitrososphaerota archaeon]
MRSIGHEGLKGIVYPLIPLVAGIMTLAAGLGTAQAIAMAVFTGIIGGTLLFWRFRLAFAMVGIFVLMGAGLMDVVTFIEFARIDVIAFLLCMMTVIGFLEERRFFEVVVDRVLTLGGGSAPKLVLILMLMSALSAALVDEVTSILFMMTSVITLAGRFQVPLIPLMLITVFATNIGSSATVVGNPIGVMIALSSGYGFLDFLRWATPPAIIATLVTYAACTLYYKKFLNELDLKLKAAKEEQVQFAKANNPRMNNRLDMTALMVFLGVIGGLVLHTPIEQLFGLKKNTMLIGVAMAGAGTVLLLEREKARDLVEKRVDWWTLTFFMLFFASVGTLRYTGVTGFISGALTSAFGRMGEFAVISVLYSIVGFMTAFMDNVLAVAFWIPVVQEMIGSGAISDKVWWAMLFAGTYVGNLTMIGSTANIVAIGMIERQKLGHVTFLRWLKPGLVGALMPTAVAILWLLLV